MKKILCLAMILVLCLALAGCKKEDPLANMPNPIATITMEDGKVMRFELQYRTVTNTVLNFTKLANDGFYDGMNIHRVVPGVLIQAGCPRGDGTGNAGYTIKGEFEANNVKNELSHTRGVISMARLEDYNSASSQFFIMQGNYPEYDGSYAAFGIAADEETLYNIDQLASQPVDGYYVPLRTQTIRSIRVNTHGYEEYLPDAVTIPLPEEDEE